MDIGFRGRDLLRYMPRAYFGLCAEPIDMANEVSEAVGPWRNARYERESSLRTMTKAYDSIDGEHALFRQIFVVK